VAKGKVLFVDDEPGIRMTLPTILRMHDFDVLAVASVPEAITAIAEKKFDVLIADLNIGQPGDGFTVVSAMRRTQPDAVTLIITGYPAFETALAAIREQVDDYVVKPADVDHLVQTIEERLTKRKPHRPLELRRVAGVLRECGPEIVENFLRRCHSHQDIPSAALSDGQLTDHIPALLAEIVTRLEQHRTEGSAQAAKAAREHGRSRKEQGYSVPLLYEEGRILRRAIYEAVQNNLLGVNLSFLVPDLIEVSDSLDIQLAESLKAFLTSGERPKAA
jgi:ActR/RegA family two-component response regulator